MSGKLPEENTLGAIVGGRGRNAPRMTRALSRASARGAHLGSGYLGVGTGIVSMIGAFYGISLLISHWQDYPDPLPALCAWLLYLGTLAAATATIAILGDRLPGWMFAVYLSLLAVVVALDFAAIWQLGDIGGYATASVSAGFGLLFVVTLRRAREMLGATIGLLTVFVTAIVLNTPRNAETLPTQLATLALVILPPAIGTYVVRGFHGMVQLELDRVLVQSTVSAPRFAVGMLASEELARLDLAAEELLDSVAVGTVRLPLTPKTASVAASLATELRLHLIEGRRETWLYHAVTESEMLGKAVTLSDESSLAGLLGPEQRDGLLSAAWLLVSDTAKPNASRTVQITLGPIAAATERQPSHKILVPIVITTTDVPRNRVDPSTWDSIRKVGLYSDSTENSSLRVDIRCLVDNPAEQ